jgi:hypothetical protein
MAWTTPGTATAGEVLTAAFWNANVRDNTTALPRGIIAYTESSSNTLSGTILTGLNTTVTFEAGRYYRLSAHVTFTTNSGFRMIGTIDIAGYTSNVRAVDVTGGAGGFNTLGSIYELVANPGAGSKDVTVTFSVIAGTGNLVAGATTLHWLLIEDIGAL